MYKEVKTTKEVNVKYYYCDVCDTKLNHISRCEYCRKDLCRKCIEHEEYRGDYSDVYCKSCWSIGEPYRNKMQTLENEIDSLQEEWISKCTKK